MAFKKGHGGSCRERYDGSYELHAVHASLLDRLQTCAAMNDPLVKREQKQLS